MLLLNRAIAFSLDHRAFCALRAVSSPPLLVAASEEGRISLCRLTPEAHILRLSVPGKIAAVCPHPSKPLLALIERVSRKLLVLGFDGSAIFQETAPRLSEGSPAWMTGGYMDCQFDVSGRYLWCASGISKDYVEVQLRETERWSIVSRTEIGDPLRGSSASFHSTVKPETLALWLAAGQDGQCTYWVTRDGGSIRHAIEPHLQDTIPPAFSASGENFLTIAQPGTLQRFRYPPPSYSGSAKAPMAAMIRLVHQCVT